MPQVPVGRTLLQRVPDSGRARWCTGPGLPKEEVPRPGQTHLAITPGARRRLAAGSPGMTTLLTFRLAGSPGMTTFWLREAQGSPGMTTFGLQEAQEAQNRHFQASRKPRKPRIVTFWSSESPGKPRLVTFWSREARGKPGIEPGTPAGSLESGSERHFLHFLAILADSAIPSPSGDSGGTQARYYPALYPALVYPALY